MTDQVGVESIDKDSVTSSNLNMHDLINHVRCQTESDTHPYPENATHTGRNLIERLSLLI